MRPGDTVEYENNYGETITGTVISIGGSQVTLDLGICAMKTSSAGMRVVAEAGPCHKLSSTQLDSLQRLFDATESGKGRISLSDWKALIVLSGGNKRTSRAIERQGFVRIFPHGYKGAGSIQLTSSGRKIVDEIKES